VSAYALRIPLTTAVDATVFGELLISGIASPLMKLASCKFGIDIIILITFIVVIIIIIIIIAWYIVR